MHLRAIVRPLAIATLATCLGLAPGSSGIPNFDGNAGWIGSRPLGPRDLEGKVVLVDFWEYTCLNCLRTLPYLRAWYARYHDDGLVIVGVQTPEFAFSGDSENVEAATRRLNVAWPVVLDPSAAIWRRYANDAWPKEYLFDQDGRLVDTVAGEGRYQETEAKIQSLLKARNSNLSFPPVMALLPQDDYLKPGAVCYLDTPEVIVGHAKIVTASPVGVPVDGRRELQGSSGPVGPQLADAHIIDLRAHDGGPWATSHGGAGRFARSYGRFRGFTLANVSKIGLSRGFSRAPISGKPA